MNNNEKQKKLTLITLILMIFTSVFGFANMPRSFYLMGYGAMPWFILGGITFFIPFVKFYKLQFTKLIILAFL